MSGKRRTYPDGHPVRELLKVGRSHARGGARESPGEPGGRAGAATTSRPPPYETKADFAAFKSTEMITQETKNFSEPVLPVNSMSCSSAE